MNTSDKKAFGELLADVMALYRRDVSSFALGVWWDALAGFELAQVAKAFSAHAMDPEHGQFPPLPADLVRVLQGTRTDRSLIAWGKVLDAMQRVGAYQSVIFDDGAIHAAIEDVGGWVQICRSDVDELPFLQKRFCDAHKAYTARPDLRYPSHLVGDHEATNALNGKPVTPPTLIGDAEAALRVLRTGVDGPKTAITAGEAAADLKRIGSSAA